MKNPPYILIMAGGRGERFWPIGRAAKPKQFLSILSEMSLLQMTYQRVQKLTIPEHIFILTHVDFKAITHAQLPEIPLDNIIGEPDRKDTAGCIALGVALIQRMNFRADADLIILPSDPIIHNTAAFESDLRHAVEILSDADCVTLGIVPRTPSTAFGYIECGDPIPEKEAFHVRSFHEKPALEKAEEYIKQGGFFWNSGMFLWRLHHLVSAFEKHSPAHALFIEKMVEALPEELDVTLKTEFAKLPRISIDYALLEKMKNIALVPSHFDWDDFGSLSAVENHVPHDDAGNIILGRGVSVESNNNLIYSEGDHLIATYGISDTAVIQSGNVTMVVPKKEMQSIKKLLDAIRNDSELSRYL